MALPGDDLFPGPTWSPPGPSPSAPRRRPCGPGSCSLRQGRGGFGSYDALENLVGCDIHSADVVVPGWQDVEVGDEVKLHPQLALTVAEPDRADVVSSRGELLGGSREGWSAGVRLTTSPGPSPRSMTLAALAGGRRGSWCGSAMATCARGRPWSWSPSS